MRGLAEFLQGLPLDLPDPFTGQAQLLADSLQGARFADANTETQSQDMGLPRW